MREPTEANAADDRSDADEDPVAAARRLIRQQRLVYAGLALGFVLLMGIVPWVAGWGPWGWALFSSDPITVHVLNLTGEPFTVEITRAGRREVPSPSVESIAARTGPLSILIQDPRGEPIDVLEVNATSDLFVNAGGETCLAVFDLSGFYGGEGESLPLVARILETDRVYPVDADFLVLPGRTSPDRAGGRILWIEDMGCALMAPEDEGYLRGTALMRLEDRRGRLEELRERDRR